MTFRRTLPLAGMLLLAAASAFCQPKVEIEGGKSFDFGVLRTLAPVTREVRIRNTGTDTLEVKNVSASCGCTGTLLSSDHIPPGGDGLLKITFDPAKFKGKIDKAVSMKTNDPTDANPHILFTATVTPILEFDAAYVAITTVPDSEATKVVMIRNASSDPVQVTSITAVPSDLSVSFSTRILQPGESGELLCRTQPARPGVYKGDITLTTNNPEIPTLVLRYLVYAKAPAGHAKQSPPR